MKHLKNILVGFLVSFVGSIPLGYLNVVGFQIFQKQGLFSLYEYLFGVVFIESFVIFITLKFANLLSTNKKLLKWIEVFSIAFLLFLSVLFFLQIKKNTTSTDFSAYFGYTSFLIGIILNSINFIQLPFWTGWNLYLINNSYIFTKKYFQISYIFGTLIGTFFGMLCFVLFLNSISVKNNWISLKNVNTIIPIVFFSMAIFQIFKFVRKHFFSQKQSSL
jgi:hypothetical protein